MERVRYRETTIGQLFTIQKSMVGGFVHSWKSCLGLAVQPNRSIVFLNE